MTTTPLSSCCNAPVKYSSTDEAGNNIYMWCTKCAQICEYALPTGNASCCSKCKCNMKDPNDRLCHDENCECHTVNASTEKTYARDYSHEHCWNQKLPACGIPLEKHTQCCLCDVKVNASAVEDKIIKEMVSRFLGWKLPADFSPDAGITFKKDFNEHTNHPMQHEPSGTNLFNYEQVQAMIKYMTDGLLSSDSTLREVLGEINRELSRHRSMKSDEHRDGRKLGLSTACNIITKRLEK